MIKLKHDPWIDGQGKIRLDWENDRHQSITLKKGDEPVKVMLTLAYVINDIKTHVREVRNEN